MQRSKGRKAKLKPEDHHRGAKKEDELSRRQQRKAQLPLPTPQQVPRARKGERGDPAETTSGRRASPIHAPQQSPGCRRSLLPRITHRPGAQPGMEHEVRVLHRRAAPGPQRRGSPAQNPTGIRDRAVGTQVGLWTRQPAAGKCRPRPLAIGFSVSGTRSLPRP